MHKLEAEELIHELGSLNESLIVLTANLPNKTYRSVVYKNNHEYYLLRHWYLGMRVIEMDECGIYFPEELLDLIEESLQNHYYVNLDVNWLKMELKVLTTLENKPLAVEVYNFN